MERVRQLGCYVIPWVERRCLSLMEIEDPQERADLQADFVATLMEYGQCWGRLDPDHVGQDRGAGIKASDTGVICLCRGHHDQRQTHSGLWSGYTKVEMRRFCDEALEWTMEKLGT